MADEAIRLNAAGKRKLREFIKQIEELEEEKQALSDDIKEVYAAADAAGFDKKVIRRIVTDERKGRDAIGEFEAVLDLYRDAVERPVTGPSRERSAAVTKVDFRQKRKSDRGDTQH